MTAPTRPSLSTSWKILAAFAVGALVGALSIVQIVPEGANPDGLGSTGSTIAAIDEVGPEGEGPGTQGDVALGAVEGSAQADGTVGGAQTAARSGLECARGRNGGSTDMGVTGDRINLATTVVRSGIGQAFLGDVQYAMEAAKNKINREGGVCGRLLDVLYIDDGWEAGRGQGYIRNFIKGEPHPIFAMPVGPSSEGLNAAIQSGDISKAGFPVVGTDGMTDLQYREQWVWPVAVSTASSARIMARDAHGRGARSFGIVFDKNYRFGVEGAAAFNAEAKRLTGKDILGFNPENNCRQHFCGVLAGQSSYATEVQEFQGPGLPDYVAMFLEPATALQWMATTGAPPATGNNAPKFGTGGAQPLFTKEFAVSCQSACDGMWLWTGYKPPIEGYANEPVIRAYVNELKKTKPDADEFNAFVEGGYVGMQLLIEALKAVGPDLTRARLRAQLDSMTLTSGLTLEPTLRWSAGNHFSSARMQAFENEYKGHHGGWRAKAVVEDPNPAQKVS